jgi:polar amino acid transport system substrate-binding protein
MKNLSGLALLFNSAFVLGQNTTVNLASDSWPPFTDVSPRHAFALDLVQEALARDKIQAQTNILTFDAVINGIGNKEFDGSAALWLTPEREQYLLYSEPYLENRLILVGKKGSNVHAGNLSELAGKKIAIVQSYGYGSLDDARKVRFVNGINEQQNLELLLKGEVDYMLTDALLIEYLLTFQGEEAAQYLEIGTNTLIRLPLHFAIRRDFPNAEKIIHDFNEEIKIMIAEGVYNRILQLNWLASDVDGDGFPELVLSGDKAGTSAPQHSYGITSQPGTSSDQVSRFVIDGRLYPTWESVPDIYKVPQASSSDAGKQNVGPLFKF